MAVLYKKSLDAHLFFCCITVANRLLIMKLQTVTYIVFATHVWLERMDILITWNFLLLNLLLATTVWCYPNIYSNILVTASLAPISIRQLERINVWYGEYSHTVQCFTKTSPPSSLLSTSLPLPLLSGLHHCYWRSITQVSNHVTYWLTYDTGWASTQPFLVNNPFTMLFKGKIIPGKSLAFLCNFVTAVRDASVNMSLCCP